MDGHALPSPADVRAGWSGVGTWGQQQQKQTGKRGMKRKVSQAESMATDDEEAIRRRQEKFKKTRHRAAAMAAAVEKSTDFGPVVGRCRELEKGYFRLNEAPDPEKIRPVDVLRMALKHVKQKWKKEGNYKVCVVCVLELELELVSEEEALCVEYPLSGQRVVAMFFLSAVFSSCYRDQLFSSFRLYYELARLSIFCSGFLIK